MYKKIYDVVKAGKLPKDFPRDHPAQGLKDKWHGLVMEPDMLYLITYMGSIWVPENKKLVVMGALHLSHIGETKTLALAHYFYYWSGMTPKLRKMV